MGFERPGASVSTLPPSVSGLCYCDFDERDDDDGPADALPDGGMPMPRPLSRPDSRRASPLKQA